MHALCIHTMQGTRCTHSLISCHQFISQISISRPTCSIQRQCRSINCVYLQVQYTRLECDLKTTHEKCPKLLMIVYIQINAFIYLHKGVPATPLLIIIFYYNISHFKIRIIPRFYSLIQIFGDVSR